MNNTKMTRTEIQATWSISVIFSLRMLGMFMVLPVLTTYGLLLEGASETLIGLAMGIYGITQAVFQIPFGLASDRIGRKPVIISGLLLFTLGSIIAASTNNIWGIILGRAIQGSGAITATVMALLSDLIREHNRIKAMAFIGMSFGVTFAIAMVLSPIITYIIGLNGLFWGIAILSLIGIALTLLVVPTTAEAHMPNLKLDSIRSNFSIAITNPQLLKINASIFCLHAILMSSFIVLPTMMTNANMLPNEQWRVYLVTAFFSFALGMPIIVYTEIKRCIKRVLISCVTIALLTELVFLVAQGQLWITFAGIQVLFLVFNILEALLPSLISKESPAKYRGTAMGIYSTSQFLGGAFGSIISGFLFQIKGAWLVFLAEVVIAIVWWLVSINLHESSFYK